MRHLRSIGVGIIGSAVCAFIFIWFKASPVLALVMTTLVGLGLIAGAEWWQRRTRRAMPPVAVDPATLPPPTREEFRKAAEDRAWGDSRYKPKSTWNEAEGQAFLHLQFRDDVPSQTYLVYVFDPSGIRSEAQAQQLVAQGSVTELYPKLFHDTPPIIPGDFTVVWNAFVSDHGQVSLAEVARDTFTVPQSSSPAIS